jgi:hypothetical protein
MTDQLPLFLYEAVLSLYPEAADGSPDRANPVWWGAAANGLRLGLEYEEIVVSGSGDRYPTAHHVGEQHLIDVERTWILRRADMGGSDFVPGRNQRYVLEIVWQAGGVWCSRLYSGVTGRSAGLESQRTLHFGSRQSFRAESCQRDGGAVAAPVTTPLPVSTDEQPIGFFRENPMVVGEYLLGNYRWPRDARLISARAVAFAPQTTPTVLTLEVGGTLTDQCLVLPVGSANTEVAATVDLGEYLVGAGQSVRWKITSGPAPEEAAWVCAVVMQVV